MVDTMRVGIVGASAGRGWAARSHIPAIAALPELELVAVCTSRRESADEAARAFGARLAFDDFREMAAHPDIDLVVVSVRAAIHFEPTKAALESGKPVFTEWPLGGNLQETEALADMAASLRVPAMAGLQGRVSPEILQIKELVESGYAGRLLSCATSRSMQIQAAAPGSSFDPDPAMGANALTIFAGHTLDTFCFCFGEFAELSALVRTQRASHRLTSGEEVTVTAPDNILVSGVLVNGAVASAHVEAVPAAPTGWRLEAFGTEGTLAAAALEAVQLADTVTLLGASGVEQPLQELTVAEHHTWAPPSVPKGAPFNVAQLLRRFVRQIQAGGEISPSFEDARRRYRLLARISEASDSGQRVAAS